MTKKAYDKIAKGLNEALAFARGELKPVKLCLPAAIDVREIRSKLGLSQDEFAESFGFAVSQIRDWEQGRSKPIGGVRAYLMMIGANAQGVLTLLRSASGRRAA